MIRNILLLKLASGAPLPPETTAPASIETFTLAAQELQTTAESIDDFLENVETDTTPATNSEDDVFITTPQTDLDEIEKMLTEDQNSQDHELQQIEELEKLESDDKTEEDTTEAPETTTTTTTESNTTTSKDSEEESTTTKAPETTKTASQNSEENEEAISNNLEESENIENQEETELPSNAIESIENPEIEAEESPEEPIDTEEDKTQEVVEETDVAKTEITAENEPIESLPEEIIQAPEEAQEIQEVPEVVQESIAPETHIEENEIVQDQLPEDNAEILTSETSEKQEEPETETVAETKELSQEEILAQALISAMKSSGGLDIQNSIQALLNLQQANQQPAAEENKVEETVTEQLEQPIEEPAPVETVSESVAEEPTVDKQEEITEQKTSEVDEEPVAQESLEQENQPSAIQLTNELQPIPVNEAPEAAEISEVPEVQEPSESVAEGETPVISSEESLGEEQPQNEASEVVAENPEVSDLLAKSEQKIEGFDGLSEAQQAQILAFIKNSVLPGKDEESPVISDERMEDDGENNEIIPEHIDDPADTGFGSPEDVVQPPTILNSPADIQPEKIDSSLYEEKTEGKVVEYDDDEYNNLNEVEYVEPDAKELMSWEKESNPTELPKVEKMRTPPPAIFKHYEQEPQYDSLKAAGSRDHYIDIQTELETSGDHSEIIEEIFQDKPNEIDSIFDAPPVELPERSKLQVEDLIAQKQQDLHEDKYRALERKEEENTKTSHKGWMVFMMVIGILFIATTRRKVRRLMPASNRQRASSFSSRQKGPLIAEKRGKESSSEDEGDISGFEDF